MHIIYFLLSVVAGVLLYWLRDRSRLSYGAIQIAVALVLLRLFFFPQVFVLGLGGSVWGAFLSDAVTLFAGFYAFAQGLDNIVAALRES
jgi:hypothetical protein